MRNHFPTHHCDLGKDDVLSRFIDSGLFIPLRRRIKRSSLANKDHPGSKMYLKSMTALRQEQFRQLIHYYYTIHPFSSFNIYREVIMFIDLIILLIMASTELTYVSPSCNMLLGKFVFDVIFMVNMVLCFFIGYYDKKASNLVLNRREIAGEYLKSNFVFDLLSCIPSFTIGVCLVNPHLMTYFKWFNCFKLFRVNTALNLLKNIRFYFGFSVYIYRFIKLLVIIALIVTWITAFVYIFQLVSFTDFDDDSNFTFSFVNTLMILLLVATKSRKPIEEIHLLFFSVLFTCIGFAFELFLATQIFQIWNLQSVGEYRENKLLKQVRVNLKRKNIPMHLQQRVNQYLKYRYQNNFFNMDSILDSISPKIRFDILMHNSEGLRQIEFIRCLPETALKVLVSYFKTKFYLPLDKIYEAGEYGTSMYFIIAGTVAVYTKSGKEVCHLEDGTYFGQVSLFVNKPRLATVVAITPCEVYKLDRTDLIEVIQEFPEAEKMIDESITERLTLINETEAIY